jgi:N utilization substance protein B
MSIDPISNMHENRKARTFAFQFLYHFQWEDFFQNARDLQADLEKGKDSQFTKEVEDFHQSVPRPADRHVYDFSLKLIRGVLERTPVLEDLIQNQSQHWRIDRMNKVDVTLLKMGIYEILYVPETPRKVVLNESIELAKEFGILDKVESSEEVESQV